MIVAHRWTGLALALLVLLQASTGVMPANKSWLEPLLTPALNVPA